MLTQRLLFTDNYNSIYHFLFGCLGFYFYDVIIIFTIYQLLDYNDVNLYVDLIEFFIGYVFIYFIY